MGEPAPPQLADFRDRYVGSDAAPIQVDAMLPVGTGCQDELGLYMVGLAQEHPQVFRVRILDMKSDMARALMKENGIRCAAVLVNGTTRFDLGGDDGKVLLEGPMDPMDVYSVLAAALRDLGSGIELNVPDATCAPSEDQRKRAGF